MTQLLTLLAAPILILAIAIGIGGLLLADAWRWKWPAEAFSRNKMLFEEKWIN